MSPRLARRTHYKRAGSSSVVARRPRARCCSIGGRWDTTAGRMNDSEPESLDSCSQDDFLQPTEDGARRLSEEVTFHLTSVLEAFFFLTVQLLQIIRPVTRTTMVLVLVLCHMISCCGSSLLLIPGKHYDGYHSPRYCRSSPEGTHRMQSPLVGLWIDAILKQWIIWLAGRKIQGHCVNSVCVLLLASNAVDPSTVCDGRRRSGDEARKVTKSSAECGS